MSRAFLLASFVGVVAIVVVLNACSGNNSSSQTGFANTSVSDPPTCSAPSGPYRHVFVTVTDVRIHNSANAEPNDPGWIDLTPNLQSSPQQVDLLAQASTECFLAMLGSKTEIQAGSYQQIRVFLAADNASISGNQCSSAPGNPANCIVLTADNSIHALTLASEAQNGLKIPSGQIAGGKFTIGAGETKDLDIDFNACASIVVDGSGQFILKPVLHAGEVGLSSAINGTVIDNSTGKPILGGTTVVALEQKDGSGVDRVLMSTLTDANGNFALCPVPTGSYDLVVAAVNGAGVFYAPTVTTGVQDSTAVGNIPATPEPSTNSTGPSSLTGVAQTGGSSGAVSEIVTLSALETVGINGSNVLVTIPLVQQSVATANVATVASASCQSGFDCVSFTLAVPGVNAFVGAFNGATTLYAQGTGATSYNVDGQPVPHADGTPVCGQTEVNSSTLTVTPGNSFSVGTLSFTGCS
jgi:Domain of unknown function (DUF4382)/Carboxypeptidase regulatory-like domain